MYHLVIGSTKVYMLGHFEINDFFQNGVGFSVLCTHAILL